MTRTIPRLLIANLAGALLLTDCTTATRFQPGGPGLRLSGGYAEHRLGADRYDISFAGDSLTSRDRVELYLLYRAAQLTMRGGYDWFQINSRPTEADARARVAPDPNPSYEAASYGPWRPEWRFRHHGLGWRDWRPGPGDTFWSDEVNLMTVEQYEVHAEIAMRRGPVPPQEERAFDARRVIADLGPTIRPPEDGPVRDGD